MKDRYVDNMGHHEQDYHLILMPEDFQKLFCCIEKEEKKKSKIKFKKKKLKKNLKKKF